MDKVTTLTVSAERNRDVVSRLAEILAGNAPISEGDEVIAPDVDIYLDGLHFKGIEGWKTWLLFLRSRGRVADLNLVETRIVQEADRVRLYGRWQGVVNGELATSGEGSASYRIAAGKIVEIRSTRSNYAFILGRLVKTYPGLLAFVAYVSCWSTFYKRFVDRDAQLSARRRHAAAA